VTSHVIRLRAGWGSVIILTAAVMAVSAAAYILTRSPAADAAGMPTPASHDKNWRTGHAAFARADARSCATCHDQSYCTACHNSDNPKEGYHKQNYAYTHYLDKFQDERECASCHDNQTFCVACHETAKGNATGGRPADHLAADWVSPAHADAARNELDACAACHDTDDAVCLQCHRSVNPHGNALAAIRNMGRGPWHDDDSYVCYKCHTRGDEFCSLCHEDGGEGPDR